MNIAIADTKLGEFRNPIDAGSPSPKPTRKAGGQGDYIQHATYPPQLTPKPTQPHNRSHPVLGVERMVVPMYIIRKIENELKHGEYDARIVFHDCRGLPKGSLEFEDAYVAARTRSLIKHQRSGIVAYANPQSFSGGNAMNSHNSHEHETIRQPPTPAHPLSVHTLDHLMSHLGIWVTGLLGLQFVSSWLIGTYMAAHFQGGSILHIGIAAAVFLAIDCAVWLRNRGKFCDAFFMPGVVLYMIALLPLLMKFFT